MKEKRLLIIMSLLSIVLLIFHFADDILREGGMAVRGPWNLAAVLILSILLYGTLVLSDRRSGYVIMLIGSLAALGMPVIHMTLARTVIANDAARVRGDYFFVASMLALGTIGTVSLVLAARGLWAMRKGK